MKVKKLTVEKNLYPEKGKEYILWLNIESDRSSYWRGIFWGKKKDCKKKKEEYELQYKM